MRGGGGVVPLAKQAGTDHGTGILEAVRAARALVSACGSADVAKSLIDELREPAPF
jgi:hypothetical protein